MATATATKATNGKSKRITIPPLEGEKPEVVRITPPKLVHAKFTIRGVAPYVQNRFSQKAMEQMKAKQEAGSTANKSRRHDPKDFEACFEGAKHVSTEGWLGIPAPSFRNACIDACRLVGFKMTFAKLSVFVIADGFDRVDGTPLVRITKGEPRYVEHAVRNESGVCDIRARPMWDVGWEAVVSLTFDGDQFTATDVANLMARAGLQVGIGEGRPNSPNSNGQGWGLYELVG